MLRSFVRLAWRHLAKYPGYTLLNVGGLALGIAAAFVLGLYVRQELTSDRAVPDGERIYRIATDFYAMGGFANSQEQLLDVLPEETTAIESATRLSGSRRPTPVLVGDTRYEEPDVLWADTAFFRVFAYPFIAGSAEAALRAPDGLVLTEQAAARFFGDVPAMGQMVLVGKEQVPHRVTGVVAPPPGPSHLGASLWLPLVREAPATAWTNVEYYNYVKLRAGATQADLERGLDRVLKNHAYPASDFEGTFDAWAAAPQSVQFFVQPLHDIYLHSDYNFELRPGGNPAQVYALGIVGLFILLIAGVNYVNLTTARSTVRAREVGVKKTMGATRGSLVRQFLAETVVFSLVAAVLAVFLAEGMLEAFAFITGEPLVDSVLSDSTYAGPARLRARRGRARRALPGVLPRPLPARRVLKGGRRGRQRPAARRTRRGTVRHRHRARRGEPRRLPAARVHAARRQGARAGRRAVRREHGGPRDEAPRPSASSYARPQVEDQPRPPNPDGGGVMMYTFQTPVMEESITIQTFRATSSTSPRSGCA